MKKLSVVLIDRILLSTKPVALNFPERSLQVLVPMTKKSNPNPRQIQDISQQFSIPNCCPVPKVGRACNCNIIMHVCSQKGKRKRHQAPEKDSVRCLRKGKFTMKKLSSAQLAEKQQHVEAIRSSAVALRDCIDDFNNELKNLWGNIEQAQSGLEQALADAEAFVEEIKSEQEEYATQRSQKWHESEVGSQYCEFQSAWEEIELEFDQYPEQPELLNAVDLEDLADELENAPDAVDS